MWLDQALQHDIDTMIKVFINLLFTFICSKRLAKALTEDLMIPITKDDKHIEKYKESNFP